MRREQLFHRVRAWCNTVVAQISPGISVVAIASVSISSMTLAIAHFGWLQPLEVRVYDRMVRLRPDEGADPRLLLVEITEADLRQLHRSTPSDATIAQALQTLQQHHPRIIGLDLYRDLPQEPGNDALKAQLQQPNVIVINNLGNGESDRIPAPPGVNPRQIGFNDFITDPDGVIRRGLLYGGAFPSFALQVALHYLADTPVKPKPSAINPAYLQLNHAVFVPLNPQAGGYQTIDDRGYQIMLNYRSRKHLAQRITLTDVLTQQFEPNWVRDKIVLIGTTAESGKDLFYTPYSAAEELDHKMAGVEVHAQIVSQIVSAALDQRPLLWFWPTWAEGVWIIGWSVLGCTLAWRVRHFLKLGASGIGLLIGLTGSSFLLFLSCAWVPVVAPVLSAFVAMGAVVTYRAQQAHRQQQMVMTLLGQNASPEIADALWNNRDRLLQSGKLPGQRLTATMLFTDIRGFSSISEHIPPEELMDLLNEYLGAMTQEIQVHHGIVNKFTGDGLLAVFGVPMPRTTEAEIAEDACRAVACALAMGDRLTQLNQLWQERGIHPIQMRVGIYTGQVVAGSLGGRDRLEYGVIGDSVNIASRLESCVKDRQTGVCRILIAEETLAYIEERFVVEPWGLMELRGKQQLVDVYRVVRHSMPLMAPSSDELPRSLPKKSPFDVETKANSVNLLE